MEQKTGISKILHIITTPLRWYVGLYKGKPWYQKGVCGITSLFIFVIFYFVAVDINLFWLFGKSPGWSEISEHKTSEASELYSADGVLLGKYFNENRTPVEYEDVNPVFWEALLDTEDERFFNHWGIDPLGIVGAAKDAATGRGGRGASTITQQLAKNMFRVRTQYSTGLLGKIPGVKMLIMKTKEWITATKLEIYFTITKGRYEGKKEILVQYANTVDFGHNAFGIKTAAKTYFNTTPANLTAEQAAVLVGMLKATTTYNPISHPENARNRRNVVLDNMFEHGYFTTAQRDSLKQLSIDCSEFKVEDNYDGQAKYFREAIAKEVKRIMVPNHANDNILERIWNFISGNDEEEGEDGIDLYNDGLKIYTTIDTRMQKYAEQAATKQMKQVQQNFNSHWQGQQPWVDENMQVIPDFIDDKVKKEPVYKYLSEKYKSHPDSITYYLNKPHTVKLFDYEKGEIEKEMSVIDSLKYMVRFMHCSFVAMEPQTGHVKAWVGDIDFDHWKYDKVTAMRQPGSTFKLFVYTEAMEQGLTPCDKRRDEYFSMKVWDKQKQEEVTWTPSNANGHFSGDSMPLRAAFAQSINSVAVRLGQEMGISNIIETAHNMGIHSELEDAPSLALGSSDVNLLEMTNAYCTVANNGKAHKDPILITKIVDREGREIYTAPDDVEQAITSKSAFLVQQLLMAGMKERGGTSQSLWGYVGDYQDTDFGGKTGTSNNHSDAWFMCVSPNLVCGAWVGGEYRCIHFRTGALGQGSRTALPICGYFMQAVMGDPHFRHYRGRFQRPDDLDVDRSMYECTYAYRGEADTVTVDSLDFDEEMLFDEDGNPIPQTDQQNPASPALPKNEETLEEVG